MWEGGKIRDPNEGEEFSVRFTPIDGGKKMEVRGYIGSPMLGKTQTWVRGRSRGWVSLVNHIVGMWRAAGYEPKRSSD